MEFTVENVCGFLIRSRLMTPEEMRAMHQRWLEAPEMGASVGLFLKWLVANQYVTDYQATLLAKGHADPDVYFLNQYRILERLGRGRMAGVYKAMHSLGQTVAIKILPPSQAKNPRMLGRFQREARLSLRLQHPNVVRSFQVGDAGGLNYLVMEYLEGETLEDVLLRRTRLPPGEAVRLIHQALMGLQHIHERGMVHRDLKPSNLMLTPVPDKEGPDNTLHATVKILDIGLGRELFDEKAGTPGANQVQLTAEGVLLGTPDYLAPEQARDPRTIDIRADIYSLGCVLYHALSGQPPFPDKNVLSQMVRHATETAKPLQEFNAAIPDGLQQIVNWMIAKQPCDRYPTPERAAQALQVFLIADSEAAKRLEEAPQMRNYLTWLEMDPPADSNPKSRERPPVAKKTKKIHRGEPRVINVPVAKPHVAPAAMPVPAPTVEEFDVELVPIPPPAAPPAPPAVVHGPVLKPEIVEEPAASGILGLSTREWILVGVGAGGVLALVAIGVVIGALLR